MEFDCIVVPCGTGTTLGGVYTALQKNQSAIGISVLKGESTLLEDLKKLISTKLDSRIDVITEYHFGGYAKINNELVDFVNQFYMLNHIRLDLIYTSKMFHGIIDMIRKNRFLPNTKIIAVHTGGLQGNFGMCKRYSLNLDFC